MARPPPHHLRRRPRARACRRVRCPSRSTAGPGVAPETRDRILAVGRRAGLDAEPPGPGAGRLPGAGRGAGDRAPAGDPRRRPVLPGVHRRHRVDAVAARASRCSCRSCPTASASWRLPAAGRRRPRRRRVPHRPAGRRPASRPARRARPAGRLDRSVLHRRAAGPCVAVDDRPGIVAAVDAPGRARPPAHRPRRRAGRVRARRLPAGGLGRCAARGGPAGGDRASAPTSRPRAARTPPRHCSTCPSRPPRSSTPTT